MVSTKLVDGRATQSSFGWRYYQVEVHHSRLAPIMGLDRLWRRFDRLDTIPHIRSLGTVAVVGDTLVIGIGGSSATAWAFDVRTKELTRSPMPDWFIRSWETPPAAFSPDGRFIAYLSQDHDSTHLTIRSWPAGRIVAQSPPVSPRQVTPPHGGLIMWQNPKALYAHFPVFDSGPSIASLHGVVEGDRVEVVRWSIYPDYNDPNVRRSVPPAEPAVAPMDTVSDRAGEDQWARAARLIPRLPPSAFPELPASFATELQQLGCTIPQSDYSGKRGNVIHGSFAAAAQEDWAVLCSRAGKSVILVHWGGPAQCPRELASAEDSHFLQGLGEGRIGFSRGISTRNTYHVYPHQDSTGGDREVPLEHDGIDDAFQGKASSVRFCRGGTWLVFSGAD
ncbi:MAG TPA: hypothetical protein VJ755_03825 [Gemmatimonadales bacterium]|nr:hypothetical protein [Gemmatimonadales bacterium]